MKSVLIWAWCWAATTTAWTTNDMRPQLARLRAAVAEAPPKVIEKVIGQVDEEEATARSFVLSPSVASALGAVPSLLLAASLAMAWEDNVVRLLCLVAIGARLGACATSNLVASDAGWISGPLAVARAMQEPEKTPSLCLGDLPDTQAPSLISVTEFVARPDTVPFVAEILKEYYEKADCEVLIGQPSPTKFALTTRFPTTRVDDTAYEMRRHQATDAFLALVEGTRPLLAAPMALYLVTQRDGQLTNARHPFGPGGEGGRDDAIFSSPANLDNKVGSKLGVEAARDVDI